MVKKPLVSIITVVYNGANTIEDTIKSVLSQTYENVEYLIIDGGSKDNTIDIIKKYESHIDYWVSEKDSGMYDAINKGIKASNGEIWMSLNSDDSFNNEYVIENVVKTYLETKGKYGAYYGNIVRVEKGKKRLVKLFNVTRDILASSEHSTFMPQPTTFVLRSTSDQIGLFLDTFRYASDYEYNLRILSTVKVKHINHSFTNFNRHEMALSHVAFDEMKKERLEILRMYPVSILKKVFLKYFYWGKYVVMNKI